jgi:hypothetical protein
LIGGIPRDGVANDPSDADLLLVGDFPQCRFVLVGEFQRDPIYALSGNGTAL